MKKFKILLLCLIVFFSLINVASAETSITFYYNGAYVEFPLNQKLLAEQNIRVFGTPEDVKNMIPQPNPPQEYNAPTDQWRYYGFREDHFPYSNANFPNDSEVSSPLDTRDYVKYPWTLELCPHNSIKITREEWDAVIKPQLPQALPDYMKDFDSLKTYWSINSNVVGAMVFSDLIGSKGSLREWHWVDGKAWYQSFEINFPIGIIVNPQLIIDPPTATVNVGGATDYKAYLDSNFNGQVDSGDQEVTTECVWTTANTSIGTIDRSLGRALGKSIGETEVTASYTKNGYNLSGKAVLIVVGAEVSIPDGKDNLATISIELLNTNLTTVSGNVEANKSYKVRARFSSTFNEAGWVKLRLYAWREAGWMDTLKTEYVYMQPNSSIEKIWDYLGGTEKIILYATINYRYGTPWEGEDYNGVMEKDYLDNEKHLNVTGSVGYYGPPEPAGYEYSLYYHPVRYHEKPIIEKQPVIGWEKAIFIKDDTEYDIRVHLID